MKKETVATAAAGEPNVKLSRKKGKLGTSFRLIPKEYIRDWQLYLLLLVPVVYLLIFCYGPMYGVQIAFRDYSIKGGLTGSEWVGLSHFEKFLNNPMFGRVFKNTLTIALYNIAVGFPLPIVLALLLNTVKNEKFKRFTQTISYIPHFLSVTIMVSVIQMVFSPISGLYGALYRQTGGIGYPYDFLSMPDAFAHVYVWSDVWQQLGWNTIIYMAALSGVSKDQHEAAMIDGASRVQRIFHVDLPAILPTVCTMLILRCGSIISVGFEKAYLLQTNLNLEASEVIETYVYKNGMSGISSFSYGAAVGLFNSVINCTLLVLVNWIVKKLSNNESSLF